MNCVKKLSKIPVPWVNGHFKECLAVSPRLRHYHYDHCYLRAIITTSSGKLHSHKSKQRILQLHRSFQPVVALSNLPQKGPLSAVNDSACPQGIQGDVERDNVTFKLWLENCHRYGLSNCDQQLQDIQSRKKTIAEVIAEQDHLLTEIAEEYRRKNAEKRQSQEDEMLPDINMPCPQGVQGEDCARFKLWLENCHQFRFNNCVEQLDSYTKGKKSIAQIFEEQDQIIREAAQATFQKRIHTNAVNKSQDNPKPSNADETDTSSTKSMTSAQKLKNAVKVYGSTVMVFHISISLMSLGFFYTLVSSGIDVVGLLGRLGIGESILQSKLAAGTGTFVVAYAVHKVFAPARIAITLTCTPLIVRYLRQIGLLKTPAKK